jgi:transcriptional regulator with GAF, ATPase, and Fis domain
MTEPTPLDKARDAATEEQIRKALAAARGSTLVAASILGISDRQVRRLKARYGITIERTVA